MVTVTIVLPPNTPFAVVDSIEVAVLDDTRDRQPRHTYMEGMRRTPDAVTLNFTTT